MQKRDNGQFLIEKSVESLDKELKNCIKGRTVLIGMGNELKQDDGVGVALARRLKGKVKADIIEAGSAPENRLYSIVNLRPDTVLFIDAVAFGGQPGEARLFSYNELAVNDFSTHRLSPAFLMDFLLQEKISGVFLLGIQPAELQFGREISPEISASLERLESILCSIF